RAALRRLRMRNAWSQRGWTNSRTAFRSVETVAFISQHSRTLRRLIWRTIVGMSQPGGGSMTTKHVPRPRYTRLCSAVALACAGTSAGFFVGNARAQEPVEEITVTGSRIQRDT